MDVEGLLALTAELGDAEPRLRDTSIDWCVDHGRLVNATRLRRVASELETPKEAVGEYAATVSAAGGPAWPMATTPRPGHRYRGRTRMEELDGLPRLVLRLRGAFGVSARADVMAALLLRPNQPMSLAGLARITRFTKRNVAFTVDSLAMSGIVEVSSVRNERRVILRPTAIGDWLPAGPNPLPIDWVERFRIALSLVRFFDRGDVASRSVRAVEARKVVAELSPAIRRERLPEPETPLGEAFNDAFDEWVGVLTSELATSPLEKRDSRRSTVAVPRLPSPDYRLGRTASGVWIARREPVSPGLLVPEWEGAGDGDGPQPPGMAILLAASDLHVQPRLEDALNIVGRSSRDDLLWKVSVLGTLLANQHAAVDPRKQLALAMQLLPDQQHRRVQELFRRGERQVLVHGEALLAIASLAVHRGRPDAGPLDADPFALGRLVLLVNDLLARGKPDWSMEDAVGFSLRNEVFGSTSQARYELARYYDLLIRRSRAAHSRTDWIDLDSGFRETTGLSLEEYVTFTFALYSHFVRFQTADDVAAQPYALPGALAQSRNPDKLERYLEDVAQSTEEVAARLPRISGELPETAVEPWVRRPLVRLGKAAAVPVWLPWLIDKAGAGLRWRLTDWAADAGPGVQQLNAYLGSLFEEYGRDLLRFAYPESPVGPQLLGPVEYSMPLEASNDATLLIGDTAVFFEFTVTSPPARILWAGNAVEWRRFARERLIGARDRRPGKVAQLGRRIGHFLDGRLKLPGAPAAVRRIIPVLVTLRSHPSNPIMAAALSEELKAFPDWPTGQRGDIEVLPLRMLSAEELEIATAGSRAGTLDFTESLIAWTHSRQQRDWSYKNFLRYDRNYEEVPNAYLISAYRECTEMVTNLAKELFVLPEEELSS